jgi:hypothetical protein
LPHTHRQSITHATTAGGNIVHSSLEAADNVAPENDFRRVKVDSEIAFRCCSLHSIVVERYCPVDMIVVQRHFDLRCIVWTPKVGEKSEVCSPCQEEEVRYSIFAYAAHKQASSKIRTSKHITACSPNVQNAFVSVLLISTHPMFLLCQCRHGNDTKPASHHTRPPLSMPESRRSFV